jgi:hypothetical protein
MSTELPQQTTPVIIKGGSRGILAKAIELYPNSVFQVTEQFQSQPDDWIQSDSDFTVSYIESVMVGEMGDGLQFCQTSTMAHPLTFIFKDSDKNNIFTISEVADGSNYSLQISVDLSNDYFQITEADKSVSEGWTASAFNTTDAVVYEIEVTDANNVPVCQLVRTNDENIYLNLEPAV